MAHDDSLLDYTQLIRNIQRCCTEKASGTLMIATTDNGLARILFDSGQIVSLAFGPKHGKDAITMIAGIKTARVKFSDGKAVGGRDASSLPTTTNILRMLGESASVHPTSAAGVPPAGPNDATDPLQVIENAIIEILGPMGSLVMEECLKKVGDQPRNNLNRLIDAVAAAIHDPKRTGMFREHLATRLRDR